MTEVEGEKLTTLRYYPLNDKIGDLSYDDWKYKTMSYMAKKGWMLPFEDLTTEIPTKAEASASDATAKVKEMFKSNLEAYDQLVIACEGTPLGLVKRAAGDAREAFKNLDMKYAKNSEEDLAEVLTAFSRCKLASKTDDPDKWFMQLDKLNDRLRSIGSQYVKASFELKAHYLGNLPDGYEDVLTKLSGKTNEYNINEIEKEIRNKWKRSYKPSVDDDKEKEKNKNQALNVEKGKGGFTKKFKGKCRKCGKQGHKAIDCRSDKNKGCFNCGKEGHFARDCPDKAGGTDNKTIKDMGMFVGMCYEVGTFVGSTTDGKEKFLLDSGATCHVVVDETMLSEIASVEESLMVGDGNEVPVLKKGTLTLTTSGGTMKLSDVKVAPTFAKNIISTGALVKNGNKIEMTSCSMTITYYGRVRKKRYQGTTRSQRFVLLDGKSCK